MPAPAISDAALQHLWARIEAGTVSLVADIDPRAAAGNVHYRLPDGWSFVVFFDAGDFDYIDHVRAPDGRERDFMAIDGTPGDWQPSRRALWRQLGAGRDGCLGCGAPLDPSPYAAPRHDRAFLCGADRCVETLHPPEGSTLQVEPGWPMQRR